MHVLVHDGRQVILLETDSGVLSTIHTVVRGTQAECMAEIDRRRLCSGAAELEAQAARERPVTAAEFAELVARVARLEKAGGAGR